MNLTELIKANNERKFFAFYPENPKAYDENAMAAGLAAFQAKLNNNYTFIDDASNVYTGEEVSPYLQTGIGINYCQYDIDTLIKNSTDAFSVWRRLGQQIALLRA